jgi:repressor LexA
METVSSLTRRQKQILEMVKKSIADLGMPPTRAEIAEAFGFKSRNAAEEHLLALQRKGFISLVPGISRGIRLKLPLIQQRSNS